MKKIFKSILAISCAAVSMFGLSACGDKGANPYIKPESTTLGAPKETTTISFDERDNAKTLSASAEKFASDFASLAYNEYDKDTNFTVAPVSVYMALSLAAQCADGNTRSEILSALGVSYDQLLNGFSDYYRSLFADYKYEGKTIGTIDFSNSIWLDNSLKTKQACVDTLAEKFHCYSYKVGFYDDNPAANAAIREFVKDKTKGLINQDFKLGKETLFALINTLYLKDIWNSLGDELNYTDQTYDFVNYDASTTKTKLLQGSYNKGRIYECDEFSTFFTSTANGNKIKFILPNEGFGVDDIFTAENLAEINSITNYEAVDNTNKIVYNTRCLFPEFTAEYDDDIIALLRQMGINDLFSVKDCNYTALTETNAYCSSVVHVTKLKVDKIGVEGAAVTIIANDGESMPPYFDYEHKYSDFVIDKSFGFILTDKYDNTLFSGVVKKV